MTQLDNHNENDIFESNGLFDFFDNNDFQDNTVSLPNYDEENYYDDQSFATESYLMGMESDVPPSSRNH